MFSELISLSINNSSFVISLPKINSSFSFLLMTKFVCFQNGRTFSSFKCDTFETISGNLSRYTSLPFIRKLLPKGTIDYIVYVGLIQPMTTNTCVYYNQIINKT